jgi:hypothetical protein
MPKIERRSILALATAGLIVSTGKSIQPTSIGEAVTVATQNIANDLSDAGPHLGFDTFAYPGDDAMKAWLTADKPYSWVSKRVPVKVLIAPRASPGSSCSSHLVSASRGTTDANDAIAKTAAEGFANGTVIFLDMERMDFVPKAMRDYYRAWTQRVLADGRFRPGYYAHSYNADLIYRDVKEVFTRAGISSDPPFWIASTQGFAPDKDPTDVGHSFAQVWQGVLDVVETHNGVRLPIDVNVAMLPSPSDIPVGE